LPPGARTLAIAINTSDGARTRPEGNARAFLVASIGNAAMRGSLVKQGATIEALAKVDTVACDKTGTLTFGRPRLVQVLPLDGQGDADLLRLAAAAE